MRDPRTRTMLTERPPVRVALLGAGTVGLEVARALLRRGAQLAAAGGVPLAVTGIAVRDVRMACERGLPEHLLTDAPAHLVASPDADLVVELMGGEDPAYTLIAAALGAGRPVVTANKHVVAHHGAELEALARRTLAPFRFEAAVGGGIPVLGPLATDLAANEIGRVRGIVNGTTNFILTLMAEDGRSYAGALAEAQARGYAEADPTGDVEGDDAVNKAVILARLAFGQWVDPAMVERRPPTVRGRGAPGIAGVRKEEIAGAAVLGLTIRLLATAARADHGLAVAVLPTCVPATGSFGRTAGVTNRIEVEGLPVGAVAFEGPGAGGPETSSAVLADILAVARGAGSTWAGLPPAPASAPASATDRIAADPGASAARPWFALLPALDLAGVVRPAAFDEAVAVPGGTAVRTERLTLEAARAAFTRILPPDVDVTLYPCDA